MVASMPKKKRRNVLVLLSLPTILLVVVIIILMLWHRPTRVAVVVSTSRVSFKISQRSLQANELRFERITVDGFTDVTFPQTKPPIRTRSPWRRNSTLTFEKSSDAFKPGVFMSFETKEALAIGLWAEGSRDIYFKLAKDKEQLSLVFQPPIPARVSSNSWGDYSVDVTEVLGASPFVQTKGSSSPLTAGLTLAENEQEKLIWDNILITEVTFEDKQEVSGGDRVVTVSGVKAGELKYQEFPNKDKVVLAAGDILRLGDLAAPFTISRIARGNNPDELLVTLDGVAKKIEAGPANFVRDQRLTFFDELWQNQKIALLFGIVVWFFSTTVGLYKLRKELK